MNPSDTSRTALATAMMRAIHSRTARAPIFDDAWGDRLVPHSVRDAFLEMALRRMAPASRAHALKSAGPLLDEIFQANAAYADVILRARYTEDALRAAVLGGVGQYVIVGAGLDSFACRRPAWANHLTVFEIDHPATQGFKRERLRDCGVSDTDSVHFLAADLAARKLDSVLESSVFQSKRPAFFSWLGVSMYLTREANLATLRAIAACSAVGSEVVFTYVDQAVLDGASTASESFRRLQSAVSASGEAFLSGFDPHRLRDLLRGIGLSVLEDLDGDQLVSRYDPEGVNGLLSHAAAHTVWARVE